MPAAAVIPAPIAYIKVVAVKKLVVGFGTGVARSAARSVTVRPRHLHSRRPVVHFAVRGAGTRDVYFEKIRVFKAGSASPDT